MRSTAGVSLGNTGVVPKKRAHILGTDSQKRNALSDLSPTDQANPPPIRKRRRIIIADYPFERDIDGSLRYTDPSQDFLALLHDDGSVEFESRALAQGGICALGLCVVAGGVRSAKERKRKHLNRVRVRFAPVPLGIGGSFGSTRGLPAKQLKFLRATFEARLEMRLKDMAKKRARHLQGLSRELRKIWRTRPSKEARRIILARAFDLEPSAPVPEDLEPQRKRQLQALRIEEEKGLRSICEQVLDFVRRKHRATQLGGFTDQELTKVKNHCAMF